MKYKETIRGNVIHCKNNRLTRKRSPEKHRIQKKIKEPHVEKNKPARGETIGVFKKIHASPLVFFLPVFTLPIGGSEQSVKRAQKPSDIVHIHYTGGHFM